MQNKARTTDYKQLIRDIILRDEDFIKATFSGPAQDQTVPWIKVLVRPVLVRGQKQIQFSYFDAKKDITKNYHAEEATAMFEQLLACTFKNIHAQTTQKDIAVTITHKGKALIATRPASQPRAANLAHDHQKTMPLTAADAAPFLKAVGIMTQDGKIKADMQSKFRQINEFLKLIQQTGELEKFSASPLHVVDCGCGNAYLTFAFFYYLNHVRAIPT
ncbi:MAG: methyltransferase, partial [Ktedonobacteraceae bacterium]